MQNIILLVMNICKLFSYKKYLLAFCAGGLLSSCQSALYSAAESGDVALARQAIEAGVTPLQLNEAADVAYALGHTSVLNELVKAGAVVAPESMAGKRLVLQTDMMGETSRNEGPTPQEFWNPDAISPASNWVPVKWEAPSQDDDRRLREFVWASDQENKIHLETSNSESTDTLFQSYVRINRNTAVATESRTSRFHGATFMAWRHSVKYELVFETPTSGYFYGYDAYKCCNIYQLRGRFWVKDESEKINN